MASKVNVIVKTAKGEKNFTDKFTSKGLLILQAENPATDAWMGAPESFGEGLVSLFEDAELKDAEIIVNAEATQYLQGKQYNWTFGTIANYINVAKSLAAVIANELNTAPVIKVTAEKLPAPKEPTAKKPGKVGESADSLKASLI